MFKQYSGYRINYWMRNLYVVCTRKKGQEAKTGTISTLDLILRNLIFVRTFTSVHIVILQNYMLVFRHIFLIWHYVFPLRALVPEPQMLFWGIRIRIATTDLKFNLTLQTPMIRKERKDLVILKFRHYPCSDDRRESMC